MKLAHKLDHITEALSSIANKYSLKRIDNENLLAYACDESNKDLVVSEIDSINADCNNQTVTLSINEISLEHRFVKLDSVSYVTPEIKRLFAEYQKSRELAGLGFLLTGRRS